MNSLNFNEFMDFYNKRIDSGLRDWATETYGRAYILQSEFGWYISGKNNKLPNKQMQQWYLDNWSEIIPEDIRHDYDKVMQAIKDKIDLIEF